MSDWIKHGGGPCPVPPGTMVEVKFYSGQFLKCKAINFTKWLFGGWETSGPVGVLSITEYRVIEPAKEEVVQAIRTEFPPHPFIIGTNEPSYEERLRDQAALAALPSVIKEMQEGRIMPHSVHGGGPDGFAASAYDIADAFIAARKQKEGGDNG